MAKSNHHDMSIGAYMRKGDAGIALDRLKSYDKHQ